MLLRLPSIVGRCNSLESEFIVDVVHPNFAPLHQLFSEDLDGQWVLDAPLDDSLQRPGAEGGVVAAVSDGLYSLGGNVQLDSVGGKLLLQPFDLQLDDAADLLRL